MIRFRVFKTNSLIAASYSKRLHADTLVTVTGYPAFSYPVHLSHVFTAPWKFKILLIVVIPALEQQLGSLTRVKVEILNTLHYK